MTKGTFIMTKGLPASGKSTWAEAVVLKHPAGKAVRVNKDLLRTMLNADRFKGSKTEKFVTQARDALIGGAMAVGKEMIISDDTNLHPDCEATYRALCESFDYQFLVEDFTSVPIRDCIARDLARPKSVGHKVINRMHLQYLSKKYEPPVYDTKKRDCLIVDIDGTLAHMAGRSPYDYSQVHTDTLDPVVAQLVQDEWLRGVDIVICSGRKMECYDVTRTWLDSHGIPYHHLYMRGDGDNRDDAIVKREIYEGLIAPDYNVKYVLDDRDRVVVMWRALGLKVLQVSEGDF